LSYRGIGVLKILVALAELKGRRQGDSLAEPDGAVEQVFWNSNAFHERLSGLVSGRIRRRTLKLLSLGDLRRGVVLDRSFQDLNDQVVEPLLPCFVAWFSIAFSKSPTMRALREALSSLAQLANCSCNTGGMRIWK
jgi:hypothetical protein